MWANSDHGNEQCSWFLLNFFVFQTLRMKVYYTKCYFLSKSTLCLLFWKQRLKFYGRHHKLLTLLCITTGDLLGLGTAVVNCGWEIGTEDSISMFLFFFKTRSRNTKFPYPSLSCHFHLPWKSWFPGKRIWNILIRVLAGSRWHS